jgi:hypothetical protein
MSRQCKTFIPFTALFSTIQVETRNILSISESHIMYRCVINIHNICYVSGHSHISQLRWAGSRISYGPASSVQIWTQRDIQMFSSCRHTLKYDEDEVHAGQRGHLRDSLRVKCDLRVASPGERQRQS